MWRANFRTLAVGLLGILAAGALALHCLHSYVVSERTQFVASRLEGLADSVAAKGSIVQNFNRERANDARFYSTSPSQTRRIRDALRGDARAKTLLRESYRGLIQRGDYHRITLVDRNGRSVVDERTHHSKAGPEPPAPATARLQNIYSEPDGEMAMDMTAPTVEGARLRFQVSSPGLRSSLIARWPGVARGAETAIYDEGRDVLYALGISGDAPAATAVGPRGLPPYILDAVKRRRNGGYAVTTPDGTRKFVGASAVPDLGWILITSVDEAAFLAPLNARLRLFYAAAAGAGAFVAILIYLLVKMQREHLDARADAERQLLASAIEQAGESIVITDNSARIIYTNPAFTAASGYARDEVQGKNSSILKSGRQDAAFYRAMWGMLAQGTPWKGRFINRRKDGTLYEEDAAITPIRDREGAITHYIAVKRDITSVRSLEEQLQHSQKMEAIGRLAGGIAHDFNNILTTINGYAEMLADSAAPESQLAQDLAEILGAGRRAALLTRQLLTFSRRAPSSPALFDFRVHIRTMEKMLRRTLGEDVQLKLDLGDSPLYIQSDPGHVDQILMNLAVNARDAMPNGGSLYLSAHAADFDEDEVRALETIPAGRYAVLSVRDEGTGMDGAVLSRIFEPFFTTKPKGKGTGLGLATVFGIVKQSKGHITVDSAPGRGTNFTIYLPRLDAPESESPWEAPASSASLRGDETVLVVEDEAPVLRLVARTLTAQGYRVLTASNAAEALEAAKAHSGDLHLLLTDVIMPGMNGGELARQAEKIRPDTRVLFMSGYTDGRLEDADIANDLIVKPFTAEQLARRVRDALDAEPGRRGARST